MNSFVNCANNLFSTKEEKDFIDLKNDLVHKVDYKLWWAKFCGPFGTKRLTVFSSDRETITHDRIVLKFRAIIPRTARLLVSCKGAAVMTATVCVFLKNLRNIFFSWKFVKILTVKNFKTLFQRRNRTRQHSIAVENIKSLIFCDGYGRERWNREQWQ